MKKKKKEFIKDYRRTYRRRRNFMQIHKYYRIDNFIGSKWNFSESVRTKWNHKVNDKMDARQQ